MATTRLIGSAMGRWRSLLLGALALAGLEIISPPLIAADNPATAAATATPEIAKTAPGASATEPKVQDPAAIREDWYVLMIDGVRAGHLMSRTRPSGTNIISETETTLKIKRGLTNVAIDMSTLIEETSEGKPVRMKTVQKFGAQAMTQERTFTDKGVHIVRSQAGQIATEDAPLPDGQWLTPGAAARETKRRMDAGEKEFSLTVLDPASGDEPVTLRRKILEQTVVSVLGRDVPALKCAIHVDKFGGIDVIEYISLAGVTVKGTIDLGVIKVDQVLADKAIALSPLNPPELLVSTLVKPNRPIANPRTATRAVYLLSVDGGKPFTIEAGAGQQVEVINERKVKVTIEPGRADSFRADRAIREIHLQSSAMLAHEDPKVRELLKAADNPKLSTIERCERLRRYVHSFIDEKDLSVGFASASEIARTKTGDCTEHGVLLAALLRAAGIPARVASGLIYVDEFVGAEHVFGYHLWTQALVESPDGTARWINLDATLPDGSIFDATHILLQTSALNGGAMDNLMVNMVPLLGRLKIDVQEIK